MKFSYTTGIISLKYNTSTVYTRSAYKYVFEKFCHVFYNCGYYKVPLWDNVPLWKVQVVRIIGNGAIFSRKYLDRTCISGFAPCQFSVGTARILKFFPAWHGIYPYRTGVGEPWCIYLLLPHYNNGDCLWSQCNK